MVARQRQALISAATRCKPWRMYAVLASFDVLVVAAVFAAVVYLRYLLGGSFRLEDYWMHWPMLLIYIAAVASFGGYDVLLSPPQEIRSCSLATLLILAVLSSTAFWVRFPFSFSRTVVFVSGLALFALLPATHFCVKAFFSRFPWWGFPTVFYLFEKREAHYISLMMKRLHVSLKPVLLLRHQRDFLSGQMFTAIPVVDGPDFFAKPGIPSNAIFIFLGFPQLGSGARSILQKAEQRFSRIIILHEGLNFGNQWAKPIDMGLHLGLETMQRLLDPMRLRAKRCVDLLLALFLLIALCPVFLLMSLLITVNSPGPVFYKQIRLGRGGRPFYAWKFRSMVPNAAAVLKDVLDKNPALRRSWEECHKLPKDPRITAVGRFLRLTSLDELPQLFNVVMGEMSLIGPRPIVRAEIKRYGARYEMVSKVRPGMTGLWQVSGRSRLTYAERVELDAYYIKNWSFWLDLYIMLKTPLAVLRFGDAQ